MKSTFVAACAIASAQAWTVNAFEVKDVLQVVEGVVLGALKAESPVSMTCIGDTETLMSEIKEGVDDFKKETFSGVKDGLTIFGTALQQLATDLQDCEEAIEDIEKLYAMATTFSNPWSFAYHAGKDLLLNGVDIYNDIDQAMQNWDSQSWEAFGENIGDALARILIGSRTSSRQMSHSDMLLVVEGVLRGAIDLSIPSAETCISDVELLTSEVEQAVTDFKKMSFSGVKDGISMVGTIVDQVEGDIADCQVSVEDAKKLAEMADNFKNPWSFAYHVGKDLLLNGVDIFHEISDAISNYDKGDYYGFGYDVGEALEEVLIGEKPSTIYLQ